MKIGTPRKLSHSQYLKFLWETYILGLVRLLCYEFHLGILWERLTCDGFYFGLFVLLLDVDLLVMDSILDFLCSFLM